MPTHRLFKTTARSAQRGMATTLVMMLTGVAMTATTMGMMYGIRSAQEQQMASHATVPSESRAWEGVELVRLYLQGVSVGDVVPGALATSASGITAQIMSKEAVGSTTQVTVNITGRGALASSTLQAVYVLGGAGTAGVSSTKALVFNGNLNYTGGSLSILNGAHMANIALSGVLSISNGATAYVSGCAKGGIELSGGGVADNAILLTEGTFSMSSSSAASNITVGAKTVNIAQEGGSYLSIKAGAFTANVLSGSTKIGTALVGGIRNTDNSITALNEGTALITLTNGTVYTLDLSQVTQSNNVITTTAGAKKISGSGTLPATIALTYNAVYGGDVQFKTATVNTFWANNIAFTGWSGTYSLLKAHGNVSILTANIGQFQGGGNLSVTQYNTPSFSSASRMTGLVRNADGSTYTGTPITNLSFNVPNASPGLPGVPYCDLDPQPVDVDPLRDQANYVFYFDGNKPMLRIQNVNKADGTALPAGPYDLTTQDLRRIGGTNFLMCGYSFEANNTCGKNATRNSGWNLNGIIAFPPGVMWFQGNVTFDGVQGSRLTNTILATGDVTLTSGGHIPLYAPNFSGYSNVCSGSFYPSNLCNKTASPPGLTTWTDSANVVHTGMPLGNLAIEAEGSLSSAGWDIHGNVILGGLVSTTGATTTIQGGLSTGGNGSAPTSINQGGLALDVSGLTKDQTFTGTTTPGTGSGTASAATARLLWVRAL